MATQSKQLNAIINELNRIKGECKAVSKAFEKISKDTENFEQKADELFYDSRQGSKHYLVDIAWKLKHGYTNSTQNILNIEQMAGRIERMMKDLEDHGDDDE